MYCTWHKVYRVQQAQVKGRVREYKQHQQQCNKLRHFYQIFAFMLAVIFLLLLIFMLRTWMPRQWLSCCWMVDWMGVCVCLYALFLFKIHFCFLSFNEFIRKMVIEQSSSNVRAKCNSARNGFTFFSTRSFGDARIIHQTVESCWMIIFRSGVCIKIALMFVLLSPFNISTGHDPANSTNISNLLINFLYFFLVFFFFVYAYFLLCNNSSWAHFFLGEK